ncbi:MAG: spermidine synthase [Methylotenera sp.]
MQDRNGPPLAALVLVSAGALTYEILLTRLFSIIQWHHFAYMMISLAMLGYGVSGTLLTLLRERLLPNYGMVFALCAAAFGISAMGAFLLAQQLPFNPLEIFWDARQPFYLLMLYLLLTVPFLFSASCIGLTFMRHGAASHRVYSYDLLGAASGCLLTVLLLFLLPPMAALRAVSLLGLAGAALAVWHFNLRPRLVLPLLAVTALAITTILPSAWTQLRISSYKSLSQTLLMPGTRVVAERSSPLGLLTVVESPRIPFRHAPGLSLNAAQEPPPQLGIFTDGDALSALTRFDGRLEPLAYLDQTTSALPYHLLRQPHVLVLGAGAGSGVLQALVNHAPQVEAVDIDARMVDLVRSRFANFSGNLYQRPEVTIHVAEARSFVEASDARYDLIQVELMDAFGATSSGLYGLSESYLYTVEGLQSYLRHLKPGGMLALTRWITLPPRDLLKLTATAISAQEREGVTLPGKRLALIRGWQTGTLLVKNGEFTPGEIAEIRAFSKARSFDVEWLQGLAREESNHYNVLDQPYFFDGIQALANTQKQDFIERYKFDIRPSTDDRPYFFHFFRWQALPEILSLHARGGLSLLELGYPILLATLLQAVLASTALILLPLWLGLRGNSGMRAAPGKLATFSYFTLIGFAFIFIEITFIQKFTLYLGNPLYAMAGVLYAILLFASMGSRNAPRMLGWLHGKGFPAVNLLAAGIALMVLLNLLASTLLMQFGVGLPAIVRVIVVMALIAPLAFLMGMPFPAGMARLDAAAPAMLPWAWGVNACATVVGAAVAALLALHLGFNGVATLAVLLYLSAASVFYSVAGKPKDTGLLST